MKTYFQNFAFITTDDCNLDCAHCMRGKKRNNYISDKVIETSLDQADVIGTLCILGGEPTLSIDRIEKIISYIIDNHITLHEFSLTINGTNYSEELIKLLDYIKDYIKSKNGTQLAISYDEYHMEQIEKLGLSKQFIENVKKYSETKHFIGLKKLNPKLKLFREGNAERLINKLTVPLKPLPYIMSYRNSSVVKGEKTCLIGPIVAINTKGIVTDCDASLINQETIYNYGNVLEDSLVDICSKRAEIVPERKFNSSCKRLIKEYDTYNG